MRGKVFSHGWQKSGTEKARRVFDVIINIIKLKLKNQ
jgi:hypothetical protein